MNLSNTIADCYNEDGSENPDITGMARYAMFNLSRYSEQICKCIGFPGYFTIEKKLKRMIRGEYMNLRATKIKEYDTKEMKRLIQNTDIKITIHNNRDHKYSQKDFCTVFWRNGGYPETMGGVFKKKMTKRFAIRICNWLNILPVDIDEEGLEYLRNTTIKEYEPV